MGQIIAFECSRCKKIYKRRKNYVAHLRKEVQLVGWERQHKLAKARGPAMVERIFACASPTEIVAALNDLQGAINSHQRPYFHRGYTPRKRFNLRLKGFAQARRQNSGQTAMALWVEGDITMSRWEYDGRSLWSGVHDFLVENKVIEPVHDYRIFGDLREQFDRQYGDKNKAFLIFSKEKLTTLAAALVIADDDYDLLR